MKHSHLHRNNGSPSSQNGFTMIELLVVILIMGVIFSIAIIGLKGTLNKSKNNAMKQNMATVDSGFATFNRMYPVIGNRPDELLTRFNGSTGVISHGSETTGIYSPLGDRLIRQWPENPWADGPIRIRAYAAGSCPTTNPDSDPSIVICRLNTTETARWIVRGWGKDSSGNSQRLPDLVH